MPFKVSISKLRFYQNRSPSPSFSNTTEKGNTEVESLPVSVDQVENVMETEVARNLEQLPSNLSSRRESDASVLTVSTTATSIVFPSPASPSSRKESWQFYDFVVRLVLNPAVEISFTKNGHNFKLRYTYIDICKDSMGALKCLELGGGMGQQKPFTHAFNNTRLPLPHIEHPKDSSEYPLRISFLEQQTVQTSQVVFMTRLSYQFENWEDCRRFQEVLLNSTILLMAGISEAKSKGRGEECISQNLRILRGGNGKVVMLFFANSQRKELKRYVSIPMDCISSFKRPKKKGKPFVLDLSPNFDILIAMRNLQISFLDDDDSKAFGDFLATIV